MYYSRNRYILNLTMRISQFPEKSNFLKKNQKQLLVVRSKLNKLPVWWALGPVWDPPWTDRHTQPKIFPSCNFVGERQNIRRLAFCYTNYRNPTKIFVTHRSRQVAPPQHYEAAIGWDSYDVWLSVGVSPDFLAPPESLIRCLRLEIYFPCCYH